MLPTMLIAPDLRPVAWCGCCPIPARRRDFNVVLPSRQQIPAAGERVHRVRDGEIEIHGEEHGMRVQTREPQEIDAMSVQGKWNITIKTPIGIEAGCSI